MAKSNAIFMGSDSLLKATELKDVESNELINTATITLSIFNGTQRSPVSILEFTSGGVAEIKVNDIIEGATSGATAVVVEVSLTSGYWVTGTAAGQIAISGQSGVFQAENIDIVGDQADIATIPAGDSTSLVVVQLGGGQVKIPMNTVGLTTSDFIRIEGSKHYNDQFDIDAVDAVQAGYVTITAANVAETLTGREKIYIGIGGGKDIAFTPTGTSPDGCYDAIQPDTLENVHENDKYYLFQKIVYSGSIALHRYLWAAAYYKDEALS